jgi:hypothetical protein
MSNRAVHQPYARIRLLAPRKLKIVTAGNCERINLEAMEESRQAAAS